MAEAVEARTLDEIAAFAATLVEAPEYRHIIRMLKNDVIVKWANEADADKREVLWHEIQAVGRIEMKVQTLADEKRMGDRKAEAAKRKTPGG